MGQKKFIFVCIKKKENCKSIINKNRCTTNRFEISTTSDIPTVNLKILTIFCSNFSQQFFFFIKL